MANFLNANVKLCGVIIENPPSRLGLLKRRVAKLGKTEVLGQVGFILLSKLVARLSRRRISELYSRFGFETSSYPKDLTRRVNSGNSDEARSLLSSMLPEVVIVNGTRILSQDTLDSVNAPFINVHAGITPKYRGVHGGYWALALQDEFNCGVTVHFVDKGIDTGAVIAQARIKPTSKDNFLTYPILQLGASRELLLKAIYETANGIVSTDQGVGPSNLFYHPTIWSYLATACRHRVL